LSVVDQGGQEFLTWSKPRVSARHRERREARLLRGPLDTDGTRPRGASFKVRVTYSRRGNPGVVEISEPIT
jgi:hypothetical protein